MVSQPPISPSPGGSEGSQVGTCSLRLPWGKKRPRCCRRPEPWPGSPWGTGTGRSAAHELVHGAGRVPAPPPPAYLAFQLSVSPWRVPCSWDPVEQLFISFFKQDCKARCEKWRGGTRGADGESGARFAHGISPKEGFFLLVELLWLR